MLFQKNDIKGQGSNENSNKAGIIDEVTDIVDDKQIMFNG